MLPFSLTAEIAALTVISATSIVLIKQLAWFITFLYNAMMANIGITFETLPIINSSAIYIAFVFMLPYFAVAYISKLITGYKINLSDTGIIILSTIAYSLFISFAYFLSFFQEIARADYKW
jgi:hypothetical protein